MGDVKDSKAAAVPPTGRPFQMNRTVAWTGFVFGILTGSVMGLWSFDGPLAAPADLTNYADTSRRLLRLGHIAFFGLGFLNLSLAAELPRLAISERLKRTAARAMNLGNIFLPLVLIAAALMHPLKYLLPVPTTAVTIAIVIAAVGAVRSHSTATSR